MVTPLPSLTLPPTFALGVCDYPEHVPWERWQRYPRAPARAGHHLRAHRRVRLVQDGAARGRVRLDLARRRGQSLADAERLDRDVHADRDAASLADPEAPGDPAGRRAGRVRNFGSRKHYDHASPIYRELSRAALPRDRRAATGSIRPSSAGRPTTSSAVMTPRAPTGPPAATRFRVWLEARYGTSMP